LNSKILENEAARREVREITQAARSVIETQEALVETSVEGYVILHKRS
jgi:hypothetical protein